MNVSERPGYDVRHEEIVPPAAPAGYGAVPVLRGVEHDSGGADLDGLRPVREDVSARGSGVTGEDQYGEYGTS